MISDPRVRVRRAPMKSPLATRYPSPSMVMGCCATARSRTEYGPRDVQLVELRLVARALDAVGLVLVKRRGTTQVRPDLGDGEQLVKDEALLARARVHAGHAGGRMRMA